MSVEVAVVRHAPAGDRLRWQGDDRVRPLDERGLLQADCLPDVLLRELRVRRIVSSPYIRCVQTVEPLARRLGVPVEERDELAEGTHESAWRPLLESLVGEGGVACVHGNLTLVLVGKAGKKGATWLLDKRLRLVRKLPPPA